MRDIFGKVRRLVREVRLCYEASLGVSNIARRTYCDSEGPIWRAFDTPLYIYSSKVFRSSGRDTTKEAGADL